MKTQGGNMRGTMRRIKSYRRTFTVLFVGVAVRLGGHIVTPVATAAEPLTILESSAERLVVRIETPELRLHNVEMLDGQVYTAVHAAGFGTGTVGQPAVPALGSWILIPNGKRARITSIEAGYAQRVDDVLLQPTQPPRADMEDAPVPPFTIDEPTYDTDAEYPGSFAQLDEPQVMRGQGCALLWLHPYQYNPVARQLIAYRSLTVTVSFEGELEPISSGFKSEVFEKLLLQLAINADEVLVAEKEIGHDIHKPYTPKDWQKYGWDYLILTHPNFIQAANTLAAWKQQSGFKTLVNAIPSGVKAADIQSALLKAYQDWDIKPKYLLLIGDAEFVPTDYRFWHPYNKNNIPTNTQGYIGTDLYYSTLHAFSGDLATDLMPDILVGRLSVDTAAEAMNRVEGIINYEKSPPIDPRFYNNAVLAARFDDGTPIPLKNIDTGTITIVYPSSDNIEDARFVQTAEDIAGILEAPVIGKTPRRIYEADSSVTPLKWNDNNQLLQGFKSFNGPTVGGKPYSYVGGPIPTKLQRDKGFAWNGHKSDIKLAVEAGAFLVAYKGHGDRDKWRAPHFDRTDVSLVINNDLLPVVWSINCKTGWFDNETDFKTKPGLTDLTLSSAESFSEAWERQPGHRGAVGLVAPTRVTYTGYNDHFMIGMAEAIWPDRDPLSTIAPVYEMAAVMNAGKQQLWKKSQDRHYLRVVHEAFHWFGDPSMRIRTEAPQLIVASHDTDWPWLLNPNSFEVHVEKLIDEETFDGPLPDATVTVSRSDNPSDHWVAKTDAEGVAVFPELITHLPGEYLVTVTAANAVPFAGTLISRSGPAAGLALNAGLYACEGEVRIRLADVHLDSQARAEVSVRSESGDFARVVLRPTPLDRGVFEGVIANSPGPVDHEDGVLQAGDGDDIFVEYLDADDGSGSSAWIQDAATVSCSPQDVSGLLSVPLTVASRRW
jgi:hypothetical protein